jgi:hypothetical protein
VDSRYILFITIDLFCVLTSDAVNYLKQASGIDVFIASKSTNTSDNAVQHVTTSISIDNKFLDGKNKEQLLLPPIQTWSYTKVLPMFPGAITCNKEALDALKFT